MTSTDWDAWHSGYADPHSHLAERLRVVQRHIDGWLDETAPAPVTVVSSCAGDGRDLLEVLGHRHDSDRVTATLIELDQRNAERAVEHACRLGLSKIHVRRADAGAGRAYVGAVPADLVLLSGVFGNIRQHDVHRTIAALPQLCNPGALVIWTRHRRAPDMTPRIRGWFADHDFEEVDFVAPDDAVFSVGAHRFRGAPLSLVSGQHLFTFFR